MGVALILGVGYAYLFLRHLITTHRLPTFVQLYYQHPLELEAFRAKKETDDIGPFFGCVPISQNRPRR